jgi:predicted RNA binding protein YcfA (HicA-like mRNA interferase family)
LRFAELVALAEAFGFELDRIDGSHHVFVHPRAQRPLPLQPDGNMAKGTMAKGYQVRQLLKLVDDLGLTLEG